MLLLHLYVIAIKNFFFRGCWEKRGFKRVGKLRLSFIGAAGKGRVLNGWENYDLGAAGKGGVTGGRIMT